MGFLVGLALGIAVGVALIVGFARSENSRAARRRQLVTAAVPFLFSRCVIGIAALGTNRSEDESPSYCHDCCSCGLGRGALSACLYAGLGGVNLASCC